MVGCVGGWVVGDLESKDVSPSNKVEVEVEARLGNTEKLGWWVVWVTGEIRIKANPSQI